MLTRIRRSKGFTLVELLIVILLIAILMAIAIPNYLGSRQKAADRTAQQTLRTAVSAVKAYASDFDDFDALQGTGAAAKLATTEPNIDWKDGTATSTTNARPVALAAATGTNSKVVTLTTPGADGVCWMVNVRLDSTPDQYGVYKAATADTCVAATAATKLGTTVAREFPDRNTAS